MALNAIESNEYPESISLLEVGEIVRGGEDGADNRALKQLANRTGWLKKKLESMTPGEGGGLPELPEGVPHWTFLGVAATVEEVTTAPVEGYPDYSYYLCLGHVWAIVDAAWKDMGAFTPPSSGEGGGNPVDPNAPHTNFLGVIDDPSVLTQIPSTSFAEYSYLLCKGHAYIAMSTGWQKTASFESGEGGGGSGGGTPFPEAPIDGVPYVRQNGDWAPFYPNRQKVRYLTETSELDPNDCVFWTLDNTMPTLKTINLKNGPGRYPDNEKFAIAVTLVITGIVGEIKFVPQDNVPLEWHKGVQPLLYTEKTTIILLWDGFGWMGSTGALVPTAG